jgi:hypothetical protein
MEKNKKLKYVIVSLVLIIAFASGFIVSEVHNQYPYEYGMVIIKGDTNIENYVFEDLAYGIIVMADNVSIRDCVFNRCGEGILLQADTSYCAITGCMFYECIEGIKAIDVTDCVVANCLFRDCSTLSLNFLDGNRISVSDCMFDFEENDVEENDLEIDMMLFDGEKNRFFQIREIDVNNETCFCSGYTKYYNDAKTTITSQVLSFDSVLSCMQVDPIDKFPFAKFDGIGWKVT